MYKQKNFKKKIIIWEATIITTSKHYKTNKPIQVSTKKEIHQIKEKTQIQLTHLRPPHDLTYVDLQINTFVPKVISPIIKYICQ